MPQMINKWDYRFLEMAKLVASWSKDPSTKVGAVITDSDNRVVSLGFNGFPRGMLDSSLLYRSRELKYKRILHAEQNALIFAPRKNLEGCSLYVYPFPPCSSCALEIIQYGIKRVVSYEPTEEQLERWKESFENTKRFFRDTNVKLNLIET